ncbi:MAG TPA: hypothetical protein VGM77_06000 [Gemmatimonadales bacterium]
MSKSLGAFRQVFILFLATLCCAQRVPAQSVADTVQLMVLAAKGYESPNGPLTVFTRRIMCGSPLRTCVRSDTAKYLSPAVTAGLVEALSLPLWSASNTVACPWIVGKGPKAGVVLEFGQPRIIADTAFAFVGRFCAGARGGFSEGGVVRLQRQDGTWTVVGVRDRYIT